MSNPKISTAVNVSAFVCSTALVAISVAATYLASNAYDTLTQRFPPGRYGWEPSHWFGDDRPGWSIFIDYNRSSEIKTYVAAAFTLFVGLLGAFAFGLSFKRPAAPLFRISLLVSAGIAMIVATVCAAWSAVAEVKIKRSTCWFEPAHAGAHYSCSIENAACNALRFVDELRSTPDDQAEMWKNFSTIDTACLNFRHARYLVIPLAAVSLVLVGLYGASLWLGKGKEGEEERAEARVRDLQQE